MSQSGSSDIMYRFMGERNVPIQHNSHIQTPDVLFLQHHVGLFLKVDLFRTYTNSNRLHVKVSASLASHFTQQGRQEKFIQESLILNFRQIFKECLCCSNVTAKRNKMSLL